jgi:hypothetical protein
MPVTALSRPLLVESGSHQAVREGIIAGTIGAATVAIWFLVVDILAGQPLYTPAILGEAVLNSLGFVTAGIVIPVAIYTLVHLAAFAIMGMCAVVLVHAAQRDVSMLYGILILFVVFEGGFYGFVYMLDVTLLGNIAWVQILPANLLAAFLMGGWLWRTHPALHGRVDEGLSGVGSV